MQHISQIFSIEHFSQQVVLLHLLQQQQRDGSVSKCGILCVFRTQVGFATVEDDELSPAVEIYVWA